MSSLTTALQQNRSFLFLALLAFLLHVIANALGFYDNFRDEFYYIACSNHLAWGYVDHSPLSIVLPVLPVEPATVHTSECAMPLESNLPICLCRKLKMPLVEM